MTPRIDVSQASRPCQKPGCTTRLAYRHHRGGERTFVNHLCWLQLHPKYKDKYKAFAKRYESFHPEDIVYVCGDHHEEVHDEMEAFDLDWMVEHDCIRAFRNFTWDQAMALVKARQAFTDAWMQRESPGLKTRRFTGRP